MPDEQQYSRKGCQGYSDNKLSQQCETIKNNLKRQITIWSLLKRETQYITGGTGEEVWSAQ